MSTVLIVNIALDVVVFAAILGKLAWAITTQHRDRGVTLVSQQRGHRLALRRPARSRPQPTRGYRGQTSRAA